MTPASSTSADEVRARWKCGDERVCRVPGAQPRGNQEGVAMLHQGLQACCGPGGIDPALQRRGVILRKSRMLPEGKVGTTRPDPFR